MEKTSLEEVIETAQGAGSTLALLWEKVIENLPG